MSRNEVPPYDEHSPGILGRPDELPFLLQRRAPSADLAWCIERFWIVEWKLSPSHPARSRVLPHPCVNLTLEHEGMFVTGIPHQVFTRTLAGRGRVLGVKFAAGAFRAFHSGSADTLNGRTVQASAVLPGIAKLEADLRASTDQVTVMEAYLRGFELEVDPIAVQVHQMVVALLRDPAVRRVTDVCARFNVGERRLQRLFAEYVGVTPRWVLSRGRLHAAAERVIELAMAGNPGGWAEVALDLGYVDQAHFIRDFGRVLGTPPARWAAEMVAEVEQIRAG